MRRVYALALVAAAALHVRGAHAAVSLTKTASVATVSAGDVASFHYLVQNGSGTAFTVILTDTLPAGVTWTENSASCTVTSGRQLACNFGTLTAGASRTFNASGTTDEADCAASPLSSTATVQSSSTTGDQSTAEIHVVCPDVTYTAMPDALLPGQQLAITVAIRNQGAGTARNVHVTMDHLTTDLTWSLAPPDAACSVGATSTTCALGDLLFGAGHSFRVAATGPRETLCGLNSAPKLAFTVDNEAVCCGGQTITRFITPVGDVNSTCKVDVADVFYLINYLFAGGPAPQGQP